MSYFLAYDLRDFSDRFDGRAEQARIEQARIDQARADQARIDQARADYSRTNDARADHALSEHSIAEHVREQSRGDQGDASHRLEQKWQERIERRRLEHLHANQERDRKEKQIRESVARLVDLRIHAMAHNERALMKSLLHPGYFYIDYDGVTYNLEQFLDAFFDQHSAQFFSELPKHITFTYPEPGVVEIFYNVDGVFIIKGRTHRGHFSTFHRLVRHNGSWIFSQGNLG